MKLHFLPYLRSGLAASLVAPADGAPASVKLRVTLGDPSSGAPTSIDKGVTLRGPGHVIGLEAKAFSRMHPTAGAEEVDPTTFAHIELSALDLPWRYSTEQADAKGRLRPWLTLVVIPLQSGVSLRKDAKKGATSLRIKAERVAEELPDLGTVWSHAHVELTGWDGSALDAWIKGYPERCRARLVCPRVLEPRRRYLAAVVPATEVGRQAGLDPTGKDAPAGAGPAWDLASGADVTLPVYHHWLFTTGEAGDFESLASDLQPLPVTGNLGVRDLNVTYDSTDSAEAAGALTTSFAGALCSSTAAFTTPDATAARGFADRLRAAWVRATDENEDPVVAPPLISSGPRGATASDLASPPPNGARAWTWGAELNLDPAHRAVAGLGAALVQTHQEELVAAAWDQWAEVREAQRTIRHTQLAAEIGRSTSRRLRRLSAGKLLSVTSRAHGLIGDGAKQSLRSTLSQKGIPEGLNSPALRRLTRAGGAPGRALAQKLGHGLASAKLLDDGLKSSGTRPGQVTAAIAWPRTGGFQVRAAATATSSSELSRALAAPSTAVVSANTLLRATLGRMERHRSRLLSRLSVKVGGAADTSAQTKVLGLDGLPHRLRLAPTITQPLSTWLAEQGADLFVPGLSDMPMERVALLAANPSFVTALLAGANEALASELVWREFPVDRAGTFFARFWEGAKTDDIKPIASWDPAAALAKQPGPGAAPEATLLMRSALVRRYPGILVYAVKQQGATLARIDPVIFGRIGPYALYAGFSVSAETLADGWYLVLEEPPGQTRFGLDADAAPDALAQILQASNHAGLVAEKTFQPPVQLYIPAVELLPQNTTGEP